MLPILYKIKGEIMKDLLIRNESIQLLFNWYCNGKFWVNRKYQRKLVWTLEEKQNFINSIARSYPVPLFLLADFERNTNHCYEIIDGMQRFEAIFRQYVMTPHL